MLPNNFLLEFLKSLGFPLENSHYSNGQPVAEIYLECSKSGYTYGVINCYYANGSLASKITFNYGTSKLNSYDDNPARIDYARNGKVLREVWINNGKKIRDNGPILVSYLKLGKQELHIKDGTSHYMLYDAINVKYLTIVIPVDITTLDTMDKFITEINRTL
jgi:hypothetical protein